MRFSTLSKPVTGVFAALAISGMAFAQTCPGADAFEPNDDCLTTTAITAGTTYPGLSRTGPASVVGDSPDFYTVNVAAQSDLTVDLTFLNAGGDIDVYLWEASSGDCGYPMAGTPYLVRGFTGSDNESITWNNGSFVAVDYIIGVEAFGASFDCNDYDLTTTVTPAGTLNCPGPDAFDPNDTCATPSALALGLTDQLSVSTSDLDDYWTYTVANNEVLTVDASFAHANGDIDLGLYDDAGTCLSLADSGTSTTDNEQVSFTNISGAPIDVTVRVLAFSFSVGQCNDYNLNVTSVIDPCIAVSDDALEPNDDCSQAIAMTPGTYTDLVVFKNVSDDFFTISVPDTATLTVDVLFLSAPGDIDCYLYDPSTLGTTCGDKADYLVRGFTGSDNEQMVWTNSTGSAQTYYIQVNLWDSAGNENCNDYDLVLTVDTPSLGTVMCLGDGTDGACPCSNESTVGAGEGCNSSLGYGSILTAAGTSSVAADDISFTVTQARPGQPGMLVQGASVVALAFKDGRLCAGTPTERVEVVFMDAAGGGTTVSSIVTGGAVSPGDTRYYQMWSRDPGGVSPCGTGSNFSNGLEVTYTP
jgi:hypothetical protein